MTNSTAPNTPANGGQILTWQERIVDGAFVSGARDQWFALTGASAAIAARDAEIADLRAHAAVPASEPVAWMHDADGRVDVIHDQVKQLWLKVGQPNGFYREKVPCKVEHYTIPLYAAAPLPHDWSDKPPTEQAWYWHWNGSPDDAPFPLSVLYSGTARKCFVSMGQVDEGAVFCDVHGGYWMRIAEPATPAEIDAAPTVKASQ